MMGIWPANTIWSCHQIGDRPNFMAIFSGRIVTNHELWVLGCHRAWLVGQAIGYGMLWVTTFCHTAMGKRRLESSQNLESILAPFFLFGSSVERFFSRALSWGAWQGWAAAGTLGHICCHLSENRPSNPMVFWSFPHDHKLSCSHVGSTLDKAITRLTRL